MTKFTGSGWELESSAGARGGVTAMRGDFIATTEQEAIITAAMAGNSLVIEAGAGAGKTSTLRLISENLDGRGIYIAFNRQIVSDAHAKFGARVTCVTAHQLAYESVGHHYAARLDGPRMRFVEVARALGIHGPVRLAGGRPFTRFQLVRQAFEAVSAYCRSSDDTLTIDHVGDVRGIEDEHRVEFKWIVLDLAIQLWEDLIEVRGRFPFRHDHYLKMWSLTEPVLNCDYLMFDEAQDADPLIASIVQSQPCQQIAVGDRSQAIYGWRGAIDAMADWPADLRLQLTQSWRFGPEIADEANKWLAAIGSGMRLTGSPDVASVVAPNPSAATVLCRTNAAAIHEVMVALGEGHRVALVGGGRPIISLAKASLELEETGATDHPELFAFKSWREVQDYSFEDDGKDLKTFVRLVDEVGAHELIAAAEHLDDEAKADVTVSTCHKTKGREWPSVRLARDFHQTAFDSFGHPQPVAKDKAMLAYVAVTRARHSLDRTALAWIDSLAALDNESAFAGAADGARSSQVNCTAEAVLS